MLFSGEDFFFPALSSQELFAVFVWSWTHLGFTIPLPTLTDNKMLLWSFYFLHSVCYVPTMIHNNNNPTVYDTLDQVLINSCRSDKKVF